MRSCPGVSVFFYLSLCSSPVTEPTALELLGVDFTCAPSRRKPITVAFGSLGVATDVGRIADAPCTSAAALHVERLEMLSDWTAFEALLARPGPWVGAFDFPFGLPRELVEQLGWPTDWDALIDHIEPMTRQRLRDTFAAFCAARPPGRKFAHRACDAPAGSSPSMKWVNPPVAWMLHAGAPRLKRAGVATPSLRRAPIDAAASRIALEGYPGLVARSITRASYKSDTRAKQTPARRTERERIVAALAAGRHRCALPVQIAPDMAARLVEDASGDLLDAVLCLVLAAWAQQRRDVGYGLPPDVDALEGWIVGALPEPAATPAGSRQ